MSRTAAVAVILVHGACIVLVSRALFPENAAAYWALLVVWSVASGATYLGGFFDRAFNR